MIDRDPRRLLRAAGLHPKKRLGQNFLVAEATARAIAGACVPDDERGRARVVEIGGGTGALSRWLVERARTLITVEHDRDLAELLSAQLSGSGASVVEGDALAIDFAALLGEPQQDSPRVLCGNLPYLITGPLLRATVGLAERLERVVFMVQDEVADRLVSRPASKAWGALTVFVQSTFVARRLFRVSPGAFHPPPNVTSAVVELTPLRPPRAVESERFRALVRSAFGARRKTLRNAWSGLAPADVLARAAESAGVSLDARGETLDVEDFARMARELDGS